MALGIYPLLERKAIICEKHYYYFYCNCLQGWLMLPRALYLYWTG